MGVSNKERCPFPGTASDNGFCQIPGIDFFEVHALVMFEVAFRLLLIIQLKNDFDICIIDVEKAFLEPDLKEDGFACKRHLQLKTLNNFFFVNV